MKRVLAFCSVLLFSFVLYSCGKAVNPYHGEFECPPSEKGKCTGIPQAYKESLSKEGDSVSYNLAQTFDNRTSNGTFVRDQLLLSPAESQYIESLYDILSKLLKDPQTPVVVPPKIVRVLILPYQGQGEKEFYSARYVYVIVEDPKWVLQNILTMPAAEEK